MAAAQRRLRCFYATLPLLGRAAPAGAASAALRALQAEENLLGDALHQPPVVSPIAPELEPLIDNIALF